MSSERGEVGLRDDTKGNAPARAVVIAAGAHQFLGFLLILRYRARQRVGSLESR
jgi:hypothetical protein